MADLASQLRNRVVSYIRAESPEEEILLFDQEEQIEHFAKRKNLNLVSAEAETGSGEKLMRPGLWKALRKVVCQSCPPKLAIVTADLEHWLREALRPCICSKSEAADGLVVANILKVCIDPRQGSQFTLMMAAQNLHLFSAGDKVCLSCCNPSAQAFLRRQTQ